MSSTLQRYFGLEYTDVNVAIALDPTTKECKKFAFFGDAKLDFMITCELSPLIDDSTLSVGDISMKREIFKMNSTLAAYLKHKTKILNRVLKNDPEKRKQLNDHSLGTVFEALFHLASDEKCGELVKRLMKWVNGDGEQYIKKPLLKYSIYVESDGKESSQIQIEDSFNYSSRTLSLNEYDNADIFEEISNQIQHESEEVIESLRETYSVDSLINGKINQGDHLEEPTIIKWRSRAGHYYDQKVFPCCGKLCIYNSTCGRKSWKSKDAYHTGKLVGSGSNRCGGGQSPIGSSIDHIPKAKATWSCCYKSAESEGCVSSGYTLLFKSGNKKIVSKKLTEEECELY